MWIVSTSGFISVVADRDDRDVLVIRARDKRTLELLLQLARPLLDVLRLSKRVQPMTVPEPVIEESGTTDYRFRVRLPRAVVREAVAGMVADISYDNVKTAVTRSRGVRYGTVLNDAWVVFRRLQEPEPRNKRNGNGKGRRR